MAFSIELIYDSGQRYRVPFEVLVKLLKLSEADIKKLEVAILKEVSK